ncbi:hypothetical protein [Oceaniovalibus guishaninsula]|uniref:hypothetical protein n=1 Tax=Oceaniovalibus guishaninsula TaxID=1046117 RepID=UPI00068BBC9A|nr:hypothetical protein [Oceaniovalibus guishaninsula]
MFLRNSHAIPTALAALSTLAACSVDQRDTLTRDAARSVITPVILRQFPGLPVQPALDCIIDNATTNELVGLASDSLTGPTASTIQTVISIASRPETGRCLGANAMNSA